MRARVARLAAVLMLLPSCSFIDDFTKFSTDGGAVTPDGGITLDEFVPMLTTRICARAVHCESKLRSGAFFEIFCNPNVFAFTIGASGTTLPPSQHFDAAAAEACLAALGSPTDCSVTRPLVPDECSRVVIGSLVTGASCRGGGDCASGICTNVSGCGGMCGAVGGRPMGTVCTENPQCSPGLACRSGTCQPPGTSGQSCDEPRDCADTFWCNAAGTCVASPDVGQPCDLSRGADPCAGALVCTGAAGSSTCADGRVLDASCDADHPCGPGLRCSTTSSTCKSLSPPGGVCTSRENCPVAFGCNAMLCEPLPALGGHCDGLTPCAIGTCVGATCMRAPAGTACDPTTFVLAPCAGYCDAPSMMCHDAQPSGGACTSFDQCMSGSDCTGAPAGICTSCM